MRRIRNKVATIVGSGAPASGNNPDGSSLTVDYTGDIEIIQAESGIATPVDGAIFDLSALTAETNNAPTDTFQSDLFVTMAETPSTPTETTIFALDLLQAESSPTPAETNQTDISFTQTETNNSPAEGNLFTAPGVVDWSQSKQHGTLTGASQPTLVTSSFSGFGNALQFDGVDTTDAGSQGVLIGSSSLLAFSGAQPWTIEAKVTTDPALTIPANRNIMGRWSSNTVAGGTNPILFIDTGNHWRLQFRNSAATVVNLTSISTVAAGTSYNVAAAYDGTNVRLFVNGSVEVTAALAGLEAPDTTTRYWLGRNDSTGSSVGPWMGTIDEARISNVARYTAAYTPATTPFVPDESTIGLWNLDTILAPTGTGGGLDVMPATEASLGPVPVQQVQVFYTTTGAGTWVCPANVFSVNVEAWAGGGGGSNATTTQSGGGGGGGAYSRSVLDVVPGTTYNLSVGAGGQNGATGTTGGDSWFNSTSVFLAKGGNHGGTRTGGLAVNGVGQVKFSGGSGAASAATTYGGGGGGGAGDAANGGNAAAPTATASSPGGGGNAQGGQGGTGGAAITGGVGTNGGTKGGGGAGGGFSVTAPGNGGDGARGELHITFALPDVNKIVVTDSFDRANSSTSVGTADSGQSWANEIGVWGISSNDAKYISGSVGNSSLCSIDSGVSNSRMIVVCNVANSPGIMARMSGGGTANCGYRIRADVTNDSYYASYVSGGVETFIGTILTGITGGIHVWELETIGLQAKFWLDGVLIHTYTMQAAFQSNTRNGMWSTFGDQSLFKSFQVISA